MALLNSIALVILIASCMSQINSIKVGDNMEKEVVLPRGVAHRLSPLSSSAISHYTTFLEDGTLALHAADFCKASGITCSDKSNPQIVHPLVQTNNGWFNKFNKAHSSKMPTFDQEVIRELRNKHVYFREKELVVGGQLLVSSLNTNNVVSPRPNFLPQAIAASLPFSTNSLPHLSQLLGISTDSYLYKSMAISLEECETQRIGEKKMCATSMEDMLQFAMFSVLQKGSRGRLQILSSEGASTQFPQTPTLQQVSLKVTADKPSLLCHDLMFPFALYSCHQIPHTKVYQASWTASHKLPVRALAVCHMNTSGFDATHPAFAALYMKPGDGEVCHWVDEDDLVMWEANE